MCPFPIDPIGSSGGADKVPEDDAVVRQDPPANDKTPDSSSSPKRGGLLAGLPRIFSRPNKGILEGVINNKFVRDELTVHKGKDGEATVEIPTELAVEPDTETPPQPPSP